MPFVNIKITKEGASAEQKARLIQGVTQLLADILGKNPQTTVVVIEEVDTRQLGHRRRIRHRPPPAGIKRAPVNHHNLKVNRK